MIQLILLLLLPVTVVGAETIEERARTAAIYVEAHQYPKAVEIYDALLDSALTPWQRSFVLYNLGTTLIEEQRWEEALKMFQQVSLDSDSSPLLRRRYYYNLAVALLGYAKSQEGLFNVDDPSFLDRYKRLEGLLSSAEAALRAADAADCFLVQLEGAGACETPVDSTLARQRLKELQASLADEEREFDANQLSTGMVVAKLLLAIDEEVYWLSLAALFPEGQQTLPFEAQQLEWLRPYWERLTVEELPDEQHQLVIAAFTDYEQAVTVLEKGDNSGASTLLRNSTSRLRELLNLSAGLESDTSKNLTPIEELQQKLAEVTVRYELALAHRHLVLQTFSDLTEALGQLKHFMELPEAGKIAGIALPSLTETVGLAMTDHLAGVEALKVQQDAVARIFFQEAVYWLVEARKRSFDVPMASPEMLLTYALDEQRHAMQLVSEVMELPEQQRQPSSPYAKALHEAMRLAQKQAERWSAPFVRTVLQHQRQAFHAMGHDDMTCQRFPWNEALPLYFLGEAAADSATTNLAHAATSLSSVLKDQKVAYRKWLKALELLREKKSSPPANKSAEAKMPPSEQAAGAPTLNPSMEDTLKLLQQMDREDRNVRPTPPVTQTGGEKPW